LERGLLLLSALAIIGQARLWTHIALGREEFHTTGPDQQTVTVNRQKYESFLWKTAVFNILIRGGVWILIGLTIGVTVPFIWDLCAPAGYVLWGLALLLLILALRPKDQLPGDARKPKKLRKKHAKTYKTDSLVYALYSRQARDPKHMAFGMWAVLEKRARKRLKVPDRSKDTGEIYRIFTASLMQATNALDVLVYSAMRGVPDQPSWVPDWAAHDQHEWKNHVGDVEARGDYGNGLTKSLTYFKESLMVVGLLPRTPTDEVGKTQPLAPYIELDEAQSVLTVRACHLAIVSREYQIRRVSDPFQASEREIHLENIRNMQSLGALSAPVCPWQTIKWYWYASIVVVRGRFDLLQRFRFQKFFERHRNTSPSDIIGRFEGGGTIGVRHPDFVKGYIKHCNDQAESDRHTFGVQLTSASAEHVPLLCSAKVQVGDLVIRVQGLSQLLIVRPCDGDDPSVRIISPVSLYKLWGSPERIEATQYLKYHIH
jgi:hypothetical protein